MNPVFVNQVIEEVFCLSHHLTNSCGFVHLMPIQKPIAHVQHEHHKQYGDYEIGDHQCNFLGLGFTFMCSNGSMYSAVLCMV